MGNFTDTYIKGLKPRAKRYEEYEGGGFGIRVTPKGIKSWIYRYKVADKTDKITLGHYPAMSLASAKQRFIELSELRREKKIPKEIINNQKEAKNNTVTKLVHAWYSGYIEKERKQPQQIKQIIDADIIPLLGDIELAKLSPAIITKALDNIVKRGAPVHANKVLAALKQAFSYGVRRGAMTENPALLILARDIGGIEKPRDRYLTINEIRKLLLFLNESQNRMSVQTKNAIKIILHTGIRSGELRLATWAEIDFENSLWTIPKEHTKQNEIMRIHLTEPVKEYFKELELASKSHFILSVRDGAPLSSKALSRAINRIQERVGIPHWTAHDLRRTFATQLGETLHVDPVVIEKCLGHKMPKIMGTYNRNEMLAQRQEALDKWGEYLCRLFVENVIPFNQFKEC
ncbi:tyrosine-type recombinase/integrase [Legionella pneumophila serogroup 1]|nr:tyrosine-type recombinase/integrase [Legionella pneumophila]HDO9973307.1 tyrosine-type recombinase/integrase [Legionella pneumophila]